jgi:hypothetical protein
LRLLVRIKASYGVFSAYRNHTKAREGTIRPGFTSDPQAAHMLSSEPVFKLVDNLLIKSMLLVCNELVARSLCLYALGFLPTMKLQLSQLP